MSHDWYRAVSWGRRHSRDTRSRNNDTRRPKTRVVVIGGGYAGVLAANRLAVGGRLDITLVNPRPEFVERIRLHQLVAGTHTATHGYGDVLGGSVTLGGRRGAADRRGQPARQPELR